MFYVQVIWGEKLRAKAIDQWTREIPVVAKRGEIVDVNGKVLVSNKQSFAVYVRPRCVDNLDLVSKTLAKTFNLDQLAVYNKIKNGGSEVLIKRQINKSLVTELEKYNLNGVYYTVDNQRVYPYSELLCQTLGWTSIDGIGLSGVEKYYNHFLQGENGEIVFEADLVGNNLQSSTPSYVPAKNGYNLRLSIDVNIQLICENALKKAVLNYQPKSASCILVNPQNGKILAICQLPSFDLNNIPKNDMALLNKLSRNGLIVDSYEPGSTFKVVTALANVNEHLKGNSKAFSLTHVFNGSNFRIVDGRKIKCWTTHNNGKHSNETIKEALNNSCNPCFVDMGLALGKDVLYNYIENMGFGSATGVDFNGEALGMVVNKNAVTSGDLARISFGQTIACTPIQLAMAVSSAVNGGYYYTPQLVEEIYDENSGISQRVSPVLKGRVATEKASEIIANYLEGVVTEGSGKNAYIEGYKVGGKTGTAQKYENGVIAQGKNIMSFVGFFPSHKPEYLCLCVVDEPTYGSYGSTVSAPVVKEIFEGIINYKNIQKYE